MNSVLKRLMGDPQIKTIKRMKKRVEIVNSLEKKYSKMSESVLKNQPGILKKRLVKESLDAVLPDAFALVREVSSRILNQRHFDVQLIAGMCLHEGAIAEMKTGEGKTLVATAPVFLNALTKKGVHVVTVNEYLAQRDAGWMGQIYAFLGLSTSVIVAENSYIYDETFTNDAHQDERFRHLRPISRKEAYAADITYGVNSEFGFDYLRDNGVQDREDLVQRDLNFAIVDEVDSILIDEARTPLIISAPSITSASMYEQYAKIVKQLKKDTHYETDEKRKSVTLTEAGIEKIEKILSIENLYDASNIKIIYHLQQALRAQSLFHRDKNYVVTKDGEIVIVDEFTGRLLTGRRYNEGLHQALEAKENVVVNTESITLASISFQNYFRLYNKLSGMTGTALTESEEFHQIYKLNVIEIPTNKKIVRIDKSDRIYKSENAKFKAIVEEVKTLHTKGQPVLIGTVSVEKNEKLANLLTKAKIPFSVLNAKNNEKEALIIAKAGQKGAVTLATNIAGRGTDIVLDDESKSLGGLFVLGSERHESRRIDNQLRGRSGRQGDPGMTQFFVSTEDDLMRIFGGERIAALMNRLSVNEDMPIENRIISRSLESAQKKVEGFNFDQRKSVVQYDDVMNRHRKAVYSMRREILFSENISKRIKIFIEEIVHQMLQSLMKETDKLEDAVRDIFPFDVDTFDRLLDSDIDTFEKNLLNEAKELYTSRETAFTPEVLHKMERDIFIQFLDRLWMQHLEDMDHLKEGIHWMSVGQQDPLVEYRRQGQIIFEVMENNLRYQIIKALFNSQPITQDQLDELTATDLTRALSQSNSNTDMINDSQAEFLDNSFDTKKVEVKQKKVQKNQQKNSRKLERKRKTVAKRRKK